ncbi:MAG: hypothetical protein LJE84_07300 [Gammaproteobacteria bacterium]|nr:hypothetical protein [Gammaproteobacteria bacterium]
MKVFVALALGGALLASATAEAAQIRFYRINDKGQLFDVRFVPGANDPGCHSFPAARRVHRIAVVGFRHCRLFSERGCKAGTEMTALWKNRPDKASQELTPGSRWYLHATENRKLASFQCEE